MKKQAHALGKRAGTLAQALLMLLLAGLPALALGTDPKGPVDPHEVETFADAFFTRTMDRYHIPGAVFVLVKEDKIVLAKGYGYADVGSQTPIIPDKTIFCTGSVGKLVTSTAIMQLRERGLIRLEDDVNEYTDHLQVDNTYPQPVTFAHLLTHTGGFDETQLSTWVSSESELVPLEEFLVTYMPPRVRPPGQVIQYSNHGMALAGYLIEVISGTPYVEYTKQNIFQPLGMDHSTFRQPVPPSMEPDVAVGYTYQPGGSYRPTPMYYSNVAPAGPLYTTATDIASFMIAHLQAGRYGDMRILQENTVQDMHQQHFTNDPRLPGFGYGFVEHFANNRRVLSHGGACKAFTSLLFLLPEEGVGFFMSTNVLVDGLSRDFMESFLNHFYPAQTESTPRPLLPHFRGRATQLTGAYRINKHAHCTVEKICQLAQDVQAIADADGTLTVYLPTQTTKWVEVEPLLFQHVDGVDYLAFREDKTGRVSHMFLTTAPTIAYERLAWYETSSFHLGLRRVSMVLFLTMILAGPTGHLVHRIQRKPPPRVGPLTQLARWLAILTSTMHVASYVGLRLLPPQHCYGVITFKLSALLVSSNLAAILTIGLIVFTALAWREKYWTISARLHYTLTTLAAMAYVWFLDYWNLLGFRFA